MRYKEITEWFKKKPADPKKRIAEIQARKDAIYRLPAAQRDRDELLRLAAEQATLTAQMGMFEAMVDYETNDEMLAAAKHVCDQVHAFAASRPITMVVVPEIVHGNVHGVTLTDLFATEPGGGHGTPCMRELLRLADEAGFNVFTDAEGPRSCAFYKKLGFVDCNRGHQLVWYPELGPEYDYLYEDAGEDIFSIARALRDEIVEESGGRQPQQINTGQCDWFADALDSRVDSVTSYELGNFYNHDATKGEDCEDATGFDPKWLNNFPQWQPPKDFTWDEAFHECNLSWTGTHIWAYDEKTKLCFDIENVGGVQNVFDLNFFKRIFDHYRQERKKSITEAAVPQWPEKLDDRGLIEYAQSVSPRGDDPSSEDLWEMFDRADGAVLRMVRLEGLEFNGGIASDAKLARYAKRKSSAPPIIVGGKHIYDGNHRAKVALQRGATEILAYVLQWDDEPL